MELKDQILQTKERKKGFLKAMPETTRTQVETYAKLDKITKDYWILIVCAAALALITYLIACITGGADSRWIINLIPAAILIAGGVVMGLYVKSLTKKAKKAITHARLFGLEKAEKARLEAEKQEARAKARAEAAQREAELALQKQQEAVQNGAQNAVQQAAESVKPDQQ